MPVRFGVFFLGSSAVVPTSECEQSIILEEGDVVGVAWSAGSCRR